jgi:hypothetical protein
MKKASIKKLALSLDSIAPACGRQAWRKEHSVEFVKVNYYTDNCYYLDRRNIP